MWAEDLSVGDNSLALEVGTCSKPDHMAAETELKGKKNQTHPFFGEI